MTWHLRLFLSRSQESYLHFSERKNYNENKILVVWWAKQRGYYNCKLQSSVQNVYICCFLGDSLKSRDYLCMWFGISVPFFCSLNSQSFSKCQSLKLLNIYTHPWFFTLTKKLHLLFICHSFFSLLFFVLLVTPIKFIFQITFIDNPPPKKSCHLYILVIQTTIIFLCGSFLSKII